MLYYFPATFTKNGVSTEANGKISPTDKEWLRKMYPGGKPDNVLASIFFKQDSSKLNIPIIILIVIGILVLLFLLYKAYLKFRKSRKSRK